MNHIGAGGGSGRDTGAIGAVRKVPRDRARVLAAMGIGFVIGEGEGTEEDFGFGLGIGFEFESVVTARQGSRRRVVAEPTAL